MMLDMQSRQGRPARAERSSRANQFYDSEIEPVFRGSLGDLTPIEFKSKFANSDKPTQFAMEKGELITSCYPRKSCTCGGNVRIHPDGKAVCDCCNTVFNDGGNIDGLLKITYKYDDKRPDVVIIPEKKPPPAKKDWLRNSFWKAAKNGRPA